MPCVLPPPRILFTGIHLGWAMGAPPGRTLSQRDWPKTTWKLTPSASNLRLRATWQSSSPGFPCPPALHPRRPFPIKPLALSACLSHWTIHFQVLDKSPLSGPERGPLPATEGENRHKILTAVWPQGANTHYS